MNMTFKNKIICICGTDTDAGKTMAAAALLAAMDLAGHKVRAVKPVQTGCLKNSDGRLLAPDVQMYQLAAPLVPAQALINLDEPCSPHLAAGWAGIDLSVNDLMSRFENLDLADLTVLEAAGGPLCPLNEEESMADFLAAMSRRFEAQTILVAPNRLGSINHALLSLEVLRSRGIEPAGIIFCHTRPPHDDSRNLDEEVSKENQRFICKVGRIKCLAVIPYLPELLDLERYLHDRRQQSLINRDETEWIKKVRAQLARLLTPAVECLITPRESRPGASLTPDIDPKKRTRQLLDFDRNHLWHPYTSALDPLKTWEAYKTEGVRIFLKHVSDNGHPDYDGPVLDGMASWWAAIHGYNHPALTAALHDQVSSMPHVMFGGITHEPAVSLAKRLLKLSPPSMRRVFLADSGSVAVEVAVKMALQYQQAKGNRNKTSLLTICSGYHGDTLGAMSVCDPVNGMHHLFSGMLPRQIFAPRPGCRFDAPYDEADLMQFKKILEGNKTRIAAVILEPIVQGAGGMWFYHPEYLRELRTLCDRYEALLILDEVATGFGRTGKMFACQWAGIEPDIMCVGKALTGGIMSLAAVLTSEKVACGLSRDGGVLMHGPTFMGNPLACAAASASLELLCSYAWPDQIRIMEFIMRKKLSQCREKAGVRDVRVLGGIGVVEMETPINVEKLQEYFVREHGVWSRPFGKLIYIMPPYIISPEELARLCSAITEAVEKQKWV